LWNCGSFTENFSEKVRNHLKRLDLYPAINVHPLIDLHPVIGENTLASHPSDGFLHFFLFVEQRFVIKVRKFGIPSLPIPESEQVVPTNSFSSWTNPCPFKIKFIKFILLNIPGRKRSFLLFNYF
jgi:hypothetical protein